MARASKRPARSYVKATVSGLAGLALGLSLTTLAGMTTVRLTAHVGSTCSDTDGGVNYRSVGTVSGDFNGRWYSHTDTCDGSVLYENSCNNGEAVQQSYMCPDGCWEGRCKDAANHPDPLGTCRDSDGGRRFNLRGTVTTQYNGRITSHTDVCDGRMLFENECVGNHAEQLSYTCPYGCQNGACVSDVSEDSCTDSDRGAIATVRGTVRGYDDGRSYSYTDRCVDGNRLAEYVCRGDSPGQYYKNDELIYCPYGCEDGRCVDQPERTWNSCYDTDGGKFYLTRGSIRGEKDGVPFTFSDVCSDYGDLTEYYCDGSTPMQHVRTCRYGCNVGKCLP